MGDTRYPSHQNAPHRCCLCCRCLRRGLLGPLRLHGQGSFHSGGYPQLRQHHVGRHRGHLTPCCRRRLLRRRCCHPCQRRGAPDLRQELRQRPQQAASHRWCWHDLRPGHWPDWCAHLCLQEGRSRQREVCHQVRPPRHGRGADRPRREAHWQRDDQLCHREVGCQDLRGQARHQPCLRWFLRHHDWRQVNFTPDTILICEMLR